MLLVVFRSDLYCIRTLIIITEGSRISLISKNNIRYEGTLYSINEADAQVALQNVKSYGTEGRELLDTTGKSTYVPPNDIVHAYLLFRGQDIKDLHVHEKTIEAPPAAAVASNIEPEPTPPPPQTSTFVGETKPAENRITEENKEAVPDKREGGVLEHQYKKDEPKDRKVGGASITSGNVKEQKQKQETSANGGTVRKNQNMVGTGASLLSRKARGAKGKQGLSFNQFLYYGMNRPTRSFLTTVTN